MIANCNADYKHPCDANDGEPCAACVEWFLVTELAAKHGWEVASPQERDPKKYEQDMRDAGRGHLVRR